MGAALPNLGVPTDPALYDAALEGHTRVNEELLRRKVLPPVYDSGVVYQPTTSKRWKFCDEIASTGVADCEGLSCWRAAELRVSGEDPGARARTYRTGKNKFHAVVERSEGYMEDPSVLTGMPVRDGRGYIAKLVDNFGEVAVSGDDGYTNVDDFYNAPTPFGYEGPEAFGGGGPGEPMDPIDSFYAMGGPTPYDMGPGVGPAESSWGSPDPYGGGDAGGGGGGGGGGGADPSQQQQRRPWGGGMFGGRGFGGGGFGQQPSASPYGGTYDQATTFGPAPMPPPPSMSAGAPPAAAFRLQPGVTPNPSSAGRWKGGSSGGSKSGGGGKWKGTRGVAGVLDVPVVYLEGDDFDDYRSPEFGPDDEADPDQRQGAQASAYDDRDISVDVQPVDGGYVATTRVPLATGKTVVAQTSKAKTAKAAVAKAASIAKTIASDKDVQSLLPPSAKLTLKVLKSDTAKKVFHAFGF